MALKHDENGFLVGLPVGSNDTESNSLRAIARDVAAIRQRIIGSVDPARAGSVRKLAAKEAPASPLIAGASNEQPGANTTAGHNKVSEQYSGSVVTPFDRPLASKTSPSSFSSGDEVIARPPPLAVGGERNALGQFVAGSRGAEDSDEKGLAGSLGKASEALGVIASAAAVDDSIDPMMKMVSEVAAPIQSITGAFSPIGALFGSKEERFYTRWFRKLFGEAKLFRKQHEHATEQTNKTLSDIEDAAGSVGGSGGSGGSGGFFGKLLSPIGAILRPGLRLFKKLPLIGGLLAGVAGLADWFSVEGDDSLSRRDKDKAHGRSIGGIAGMFGGMAAGAAAGTLLGPIGTILGGVAGAFFGDQAGQIIGDIMGGWVNDLRAFDIPGKIVSAWTAVTDKWDRLTATVREKWDKIAGAMSSAISSVKTAISDWFGIDLPGAARITEAAWDSVNDGIDYLSKNTSIGRGIDAASEMVSGIFGSWGDDGAPVSTTTVIRPVPIAPAAMPKISDAGKPPPIETKLSSSEATKVSVSIAPQDAGQDVRDRGIAHIASGGVG